MAKLQELDDKMPELFAEMRTDLAGCPLIREFVITRGAYIADPDKLVFEYEELVEYLTNH